MAGAAEGQTEHDPAWQAINRSQAVIEFALDGTILHANSNFLAAVGYRLDEIAGKHHRIFCTEDYARSAEYARFWQKLGEGRFDAGAYKRLAKDGREVWLQATYNPILDESGRPFKIVKFATDITQNKERNAEFEGGGQRDRSITGGDRVRSAGQCAGSQ
jgi:methyl-accepting chemotaxis protein